MSTSTPVHHRWVTPDAVESITLRLGEAGARWVANVDSVIDGLCEQWGLRPAHVIGGGTYSAVIAATTADGEPVVVKIAPDPASTRKEAATYQAWEASMPGACPHVHHIDVATGGLCVERVHPGERFPVQHEIDDAELATVAQLVAVTSGAAWSDAAPFDTTNAQAARRLETIEHRATTLQLSCAARVIACAAAGVEALEGRFGTPALCHGDLTRDNLLTCGTRGWRLIDPVGLLGDVEFDVAFHAVCRGNGHGVIRRLDTYASELGLDRQLLGAAAALFAADRLVIAHWYQLRLETIEPLDALVANAAELLGS